MPVVGVHCRAWTLPVVAAGPAQSKLMVQGLLVKDELSVASGEPQATAVLSDAAGSASPPLTEPLTVPLWGKPPFTGRAMSFGSARVSPLKMMAAFRDVTGTMTTAS